MTTVSDVRLPLVLFEPAPMFGMKGHGIELLFVRKSEEVVSDEISIGEPRATSVQRLEDHLSVVVCFEVDLHDFDATHDGRNQCFKSLLGRVLRIVEGIILDTNLQPPVDSGFKELDGAF